MADSLEDVGDVQRFTCRFGWADKAWLALGLLLLYAFFRALGMAAEGNAGFWSVVVLAFSYSVLEVFVATCSPYEVVLDTDSVIARYRDGRENVEIAGSVATLMESEWIASAAVVAGNGRWFYVFGTRKDRRAFGSAFRKLG